MRNPDDLPPLTRAVVEARAAIEFPDADPAEILVALDRYGVEPYEAEVHRVHLAVLKLSAGRRDLLDSNVTAAKTDYRDVLAYAEYPAAMALPAPTRDRSNAEAISRARRADAAQYREWLNGR